MAPVIGYWGPPTSTIDWCEENYVVSYYIAEFWNTISNLAMILPSFVGYYYALKNDLDRRFLVCFVAFGLVGFGSWFFHMTLLYEMQLFDELPMIWGSIILLYTMMKYYYEIYQTNRKENIQLIMKLFLYGFITTLIYLIFKVPILFQASYGFLVVYILYLDICFVKYRPCNRTIFTVSLLFYHGGFLLWLIDNFCCQQLINIRQSMPILNSITQLHAWWHLFAGYGAYLHILFVVHSNYHSKNLRFKFVWFIGLILDSKHSDECSISNHSTDSNSLSRKNI